MSATAERSFSTMRNSYLKSTMGESRLHGLPQISINRDLPIDPEKVVDELKKKKAASELHTLTNLCLSADGFSLCMPIGSWPYGLMEYGLRIVFLYYTVLVGTSYVSTSDQNSFVT